MPRLIITADIHGSLASWITIKSLLCKGDSLAIAGDLFDTRYGNFSNSDFQPEAIRDDLKKLNHPVHYVYGNCDDPSFYPGFTMEKTFEFQSKMIFMGHGNRPLEFDADSDIVIQGHTHNCSLTRHLDQIFLNPGSIACPRNGLYTYGLLEKDAVHLVDLKSGKSLLRLDV
jgi:putative phosphoesterase